MKKIFFLKLLDIIHMKFQNVSRECGFFLFGRRIPVDVVLKFIDSRTWVRIMLIVEDKKSSF